MTTHGLTHHPLYKTWEMMKQRCYNSNAHQYEDYGGRGITVCDEWVNSFPQFLSDMGEKPTPNHTLDRVDNSLGYSPDNCRWKTRSEQQKNKRIRKSTRWVTINGETKSATDWCKEYGINRQTFLHRLNRGIEGEELIKPVDIKRSKCSKKRWSN